MNKYKNLSYREEIKKIYDILRMNVLAETSMKKKNLQSANSSETNLDVESSMVKILSQIISEAEDKFEVHFSH